MSGNEVEDNTHNFFDQGNVTEAQHSPQVANGNWPFFNNSWVQRQNAVLLNSAARGYSLQPSAESGRGNGWQVSQLPLAMDYAQLPLKLERNHHSVYSGNRDTTQLLLTRPSQNEIQPGDAISNQHDMIPKDLSHYESSPSNMSRYALGSTRNSDIIDGGEAPVNFDFLGSQQSLMRNHQSSRAQLQTRQQSGLDDMQQWQQQQQLVSKHFHELQRQQHVLQLNQEARQQYLSVHHYAVPRHSPNDHIQASVSGAVTCHESSNYMLTSDLTGADLKVPTSAQLFGANVNWAQRSGGYPVLQGFTHRRVFPQDQGQALNLVGSISQQQVESVYGAPISSARGSSFIHYPHFQSISDGPNMLNRMGGSQMEKRAMPLSQFDSFENDQSAVLPDSTTVQDVSLDLKQGFQGKFLFRQTSLLNINNDVNYAGKFQRANSFSRDVSVEHQGGQDSSIWTGNIQQKNAVQVDTSHSVATLDPTEEKILFSTDDNDWGAFSRSNCLSTGGYTQGNHLDGSEYLNAYPPVYSGSWSALMQSAVAEASSNDTAPQEQWSGLSFQQTELSSTGNHASLMDNNVQNSSSSKAFPVFEDSSSSPMLFPQSSTRFGYGGDKMRTGVSHESLQLSHQEGGWLGQNAPERSLEKKFYGQASISSGKASAGGIQMSEKSCSALQSTETRAQSACGLWLHQQHRPLCAAGSREVNDWNFNERLAPSGESQSGDSKMIMPVGRCHDGGLWRAVDSHTGSIFPISTSGLEQIKFHADSLKAPDIDSHANSLSTVTKSCISKVQDINQEAQNNQNYNPETKAFVESLMRCQRSESMEHYLCQGGKGLESCEMPTGNSDRVSGENHNYKHQKETSVQSHIVQHNAHESGIKENAWLNGNDSHPAVGGSQKSGSQVGRKAAMPRKFQYHPMGNIEVETTESIRFSTNSQSLLQSVMRGQRSQEQGFFGQSKSSSHQYSGHRVEKGYLTDVQKNTTGVEELSSRSVQSAHEAKSSSFDGSSSVHVLGKSTVHTSQNMLELFRKMDQPKENKCISGVGSSQTNVPDMADAGSSDASNSHMHNNLSGISQGFGLRLAPPSQRLLMVNKQNLSNVNSRHIVQYVVKRGGTFSSIKSLSSPVIEEIPQQEPQENMNLKSGVSIKDEPSRSAFHGCSSPFLSSQNMISHECCESGQMETDKSDTPMSLDPSDFNPPDKSIAQVGGIPNSFSGTLTDHQDQASLSGEASNVAFTNLGTQTNQIEQGKLQSLNLDSSFDFARCPGPQALVPGLQQGGSFATMLQHLYTNVSSRQCSDHMVHPDLFQSMCPPPSSFETKVLASCRTDDQFEEKCGKSLPSEVCISVDEVRSTCREEQQIIPGNIDVAAPSIDARQWQEDSGQQEPRPTEKAFSTNASTSHIDVEAFGCSVRPPGALLQNYSLLHQMQTMKEMEVGSNKVSKKGYQGDQIADAQKMVVMADKQSLDSFGVQARGLTASDSLSETKMLNFSSEARDDQSAIVSSPYHGHVDIKSTAFIEGSTQSLPVDPQMAPSWFDKYGTYKNGEILAMYDGLNNLKRNAKVVAKQISSGRSLDNSQSTPQAAGVEQAVSDNVAASCEHLGSPQLMRTVSVDHSLAVAAPKKRKTDTSELIPWHMEVTQGFKRLQTIREAEMDWAQATNRRIEKMEYYSDNFEDRRSLPWPRRRLILTTQLMQQLLRSLPVAILSASTTAEYQAMTFLASRLALGDACSLLCSGRDSHENSNDRNVEPEKSMTSASVSKNFLRTVEDFIDRAAKLEGDFSRQEKAFSILELRVECRDLERFSIINRFAKFHGRGTVDGSDGSSCLEATKVPPERYVTAIALSSPRNIPEGVPCLSL